MGRNLTMGKRVLAWVLFVVMGIDSFGGAVPASVQRVYATDYEKASEEAEEVIRAAEQAAGIGTEEDGAGTQTWDEGELSLYNAGQGTVFHEDMVVAERTELAQDTEVGNLTVSAELHLNGYRLTVYGDVKVDASLFMEEGCLLVEGDYEEGRNANVSMTSPNDCIEVAGDYIFSAEYLADRTMKQGTVRIGGDVFGTGMDGSCSRKIQFDPSCRVVLNGSGMQTVDIQTDSGFRISSLFVENSSEDGVVSEHILNCDSITDREEKLHYRTGGSFGETLTEDKIVEGDYCLLGGTLDLAGHSLTVRGNFFHAGGSLLINGGSLDIGGDYRRQLCYTENGRIVSDYSVGRLVMGQEKDYVRIGGDYVDSCLRSTEGDLTAGTLELKGSMLADDRLYHALFYAEQDHMVRFSGNGVQTVKTGALYSGSQICFAGLSVEQEAGGRIEWDRPILVTGSVAHRSGNITGETRLEGTKIESADLYGDIRLEKDYVFRTDVNLHGSLYLGKGAGYVTNISFEGCGVSVSGSLYHNSVTLKFAGEEAAITVMGDYVMGNQSFNKVDSGVIRIAGDFKKNGNASISFGEGAQVYFIGSKPQNVSVSHADTLFTNVVVDNPEGVTVEDNIAVMNVSCRQGVLSYVSGGVHGFRVEEDGEYDGDLVIGGGALDLNGHSYHVKGNLVISNGALDMTHETDRLTVDGNFETSSTVNHTGKLTGGILEIKGNFSQTRGTYAFVAGGGHKTVFSGGGKQEVSFASPDTCCFGSLGIAGTEGIRFSTAVRVSGKVSQNGSAEGVLGITADTIFEGKRYHGDVRLAENYTLADDLRIEGNLTAARCLYLKGKTLEITGTATVGNDVYFDRGRLVCGCLDLQNYGKLYMKEGEDRLTVEQDCMFGTGYSPAITGGRIEVGGDFSFKKNQGSRIVEDVVVELNGKGKQTVTMYGGIHTFGTLVLNNMSEEGIHVAENLEYMKIDNTSGTKVTFADGGILGYVLQEDEVTEGSLKVSGGELDLNGHSLTVRGDFLQNAGSVKVNGGVLTVEGDYCLAKRVEKEDGVLSYENSAGQLYMGEKDCICVMGDLYTAAADKNRWSCTGGTLKLAGNFTVLNGTYVEFGKGTSLVLNGMGRQQFSFVDGRMVLGSLTMENPDGVAFPDGAAVKLWGKLDTNGYPAEGKIFLCAGAETADAAIKGNLAFEKGCSLTHDLHVDGDVDLGGLYLNGYHLTVGGNCMLNDSSVCRDNGILEVKGDLVYGGGRRGYQGTETNRVILSGDRKQTIPANDLSWSW